MYKTISGLKIKAVAAVITLIFAAGLFCIRYPVLPAAADAREEYDIVSIYSAEQLRVFSDNIRKGLTKTLYCVLENDIDLSDLENLSEKGFKPIGYKAQSSEIPFEGIFDGAGYTIKGLWINAPDNVSGAGLFGYNTGTIKNLNIEVDVFKGGIEAGFYAGAVAGINQGTVENCTVSGEISAERYVGGICGENRGTIRNCVNYASVFGQTGIGGIAGGNRGDNQGVIEFCQNGADIAGTGGNSFLVGGIVGDATNMQVMNCANYGAVTGDTMTGGVCGYAQKTEIANCLNTGDVFGMEYIGGIMGIGVPFNRITNCLNTGEVSGVKYAGAITCDDGTVENSYYLARAATDTRGIAATANQLITRGFLSQLNNGGSEWILRAPDGYHYYPELAAFTYSVLSKQNAQSGIAAYEGAPLLSRYNLTYGQTPEALIFVADENGTFVWQQPYEVLDAGQNVVIYADFIPFGNDYGELYDMEIIVTVNKAQSVLSISMENFRAGTQASKPVISIIAGQSPGDAVTVEYKKRGTKDSSYISEIPKKAGKYTVRAYLAETHNYLAAYEEFDFEILPDLTWLYFLATALVTIAALTAAIYFLNKKYKFGAKVKARLSPKTVTEQVFVEKLVYVEADAESLRKQKMDTLKSLLTSREYQVAAEMLRGKTRREIAAAFNISEDTVKKHIENVLQKTYCQNQKVFLVKYM